MKSQLAILVLTAVVFSGCYKDKGMPDYRPILERHTWQLAVKGVGGASFMQPCDLSLQLTYSKDGTGKYYNPTPCDTNTPTTSTFSWNISADDYHLYERPGSSGTQIVWNLSRCTDDTLMLTGVMPAGVNELLIYTPKKK